MGDTDRPSQQQVPATFDTSWVTLAGPFNTGVCRTTYTAVADRIRQATSDYPPPPTSTKGASDIVAQLVLVVRVVFVVSEKKNTGILGV